MNYEEFLEYVKKSIQDFYGPSVNVTVHSVTKNNGVSMEGLSVMEKGKNISPTIYLNSYFEEYRHGRVLTEIVSTVMEIYEESKTSYSIDVGFFTDYKKVKNKLVYKVVNYEKNRELLKQIPHRKVLDLAMVYYCLVENDVIGGATILVHDTHLNMWGISEEELYEAARKNTEVLLPPEAVCMTDILYEVVEKNVQEDLSCEVCEEDSEIMIQEMIEEIKNSENAVPMYVLSNQYRVHGASCMLYQDLLKNFAKEKESNLFIIPSSIHEVIIVPEGADVEGEKLYRMLNEVNETQLADEEILSGELYYYDRSREKLDLFAVR